MRKEPLRAAARACTLWLPQRGTGPWPCVYLCGGRMAQMLAPCLAQEPPLALCCVEAAGARDFTPWPAPPLAHGEAFTGGAKEYLACLLEEVAPCLEARYGLSLIHI